MAEFWQWIQKNDLRHFVGTPIVPVKPSTSSSSSDIYPLTKRNGLVYVAPHLYNKALVTGLKKCSMKFVNCQIFTSFETS